MSDEALTQSINNLNTLIQQMMRENSRSLGSNPQANNNGAVGDELESSLDELGNSVEATKKEIERLEKQTGKLSRANKNTLRQRRAELEILNKRNEVQRAANAQDETALALKKEQLEQLEEEERTRRAHTDELEKSKNSLIKFAKGFVGWDKPISEGIKNTTEDFRASLGTGIELTAAQYEGSVRLGISQQELIKVQHQNSQLYLSMETNGRDFIGTLNSAANGLTAYTTGTKEATALAASNLSAANSLGLSWEDSVDVNTQLNDSYKSLNSSALTSADQFSKLTNSLFKDAAVREELLKIDKKERKKVYAQTSQMYNSLQVEYGHTEEASRELVKRYNTMFRKESAKDFLKKTLKTQAMMGAMGVEGSGDYYKLAEKERYGTLNEDETAKLAAIMSKAGDKSYSMQQGGLATDLFYDAASKGTNLEEMKGFSTEGTRADINPENQRSGKSGIEIGAAEALRFYDDARNFFDTGPVEIAVALASTLAGSALFASLGKWALSTAGPALATAATSTAALATAAVAAAATVGYGLGTVFDKAFAYFNPEAHAESQEVVGGTIDSMISMFTDGHALDSMKSFWIDKPVNALSELATSASETLAGVKEAASTKLSSMVDSVLDIGPKITGWIDDLTLNIKNLFLGIWENIKSIPGFSSILSGSNTNKPTDFVFGGNSAGDSITSIITKSVDKQTDATATQAAAQAADLVQLDTFSLQELIQQMTIQNQLIAEQNKLTAEIRDSNEVVSNQTKRPKFVTRPTLPVT